MCNENETKKKRRTHKNVIDGMKPFIRCIQRIDENNLHELRVNNYGYNEGTICLVNGVNWYQRDGFQAWAHEQAPLNSHMLVLKIGGAKCWVADSIYIVLNP